MPVRRCADDICHIKEIPYHAPVGHYIAAHMPRHCVRIDSKRALNVRCQLTRMMISTMKKTI